MGDPVTGVAPKNFVDIFFREERMPIKEGWTRPTTLIRGQTISSIADIIEAASELGAANVLSFGSVLTVMLLLAHIPTSGSSSSSGDSESDSYNAEIQDGYNGRRYLRSVFPRVVIIEDGPGFSLSISPLVAKFN
ncbi:uncharacterized protein EV420DRAFT_1734358 [Desarmillaria tabescens]|uniref:Uncharacterized protein n=1 Tax=Armillaria tabescens TaxID=1929756 RepID=A0AA39TSG0_ARMTA|nr:uncharacterized protein EV420DRAFT_1734358 [Desarmillaria tabescens]KAK0462269.1 hypothetical protein EV420DRAFT_1734358 [Desarmillaria tabescens]